jgi:Zn finger protein HypA/HybF involved in hydrogenase expression
MHVRATTAISKGSQLYSCYTYTLSGTMDRQQHLMEGKYFQCQCERCSDPTELETHFSSMKCRDCLYGDVDSSNPLGNTFKHNEKLFTPRNIVQT